MNCLYVAEFQLSDGLPDPCNVLNVFLYKMNLLCSPGCKFIAYTPGSGKKIKHCNVFKINPVAQDVEESLPCKIGGRPCPEA